LHLKYYFFAKNHFSVFGENSFWKMTPRNKYVRGNLGRLQFGRKWFTFLMPETSSARCGPKEINLVI